VKKQLFVIGVALLLFSVLLFGVGTASAADATQTTSAAPAQEADATAAMTESVTVTVPFLEEWMGSPHADAASEAFRHWDEEDPAEIPVECAKCHSSTGYLDFLGADGSEAGAVDAAVAPGTVVDCVACHNDVTIVKDSVTMPSGLTLTNLGDESRCMECHQGRESKFSVDKAIADSGADLDTVSEDLGFLNIHYYAAAATKYGTLAKGGYEYDGKAYDANFMHVPGFETCIDCHKGIAHHKPANMPEDEE